MASVNELQDELRRLVGLSTTATSGARNDAAAQPLSAGSSTDAAAASVVRELLSVTGSAPGASAADTVSTEMAALRQQLGAVRESVERQREALDANARTVSESTNSSRSGVDWLGALRDVASGARGSSATGGFSLGVSPILSLLGRLFFRRDQPAEDPLTPFSLPDPVRLDAALSTGREGLSAVNYSADGTPRAAASASAASVPPAVAPITIQVQTMDSRSFLDNSDQIARAVREAMLNSHSLNDVVGEM